MGFFSKHFVEVKNASKITYSESDLRKLDRTYEKEVFPLKKKRVMSTIRKVPQRAYLSQLRDYAFEKILDGHGYTFKHLLVIPNPYDLVKQSAMILFNSSKETKVRYRVVGDTTDVDFVGETEYTTRHRVPIMGLYANRSNKVELELIDRENKVLKRRMLRIYVPNVRANKENVLGEHERKDATHFPFTFINGVGFRPMAIDSNGEVRYTLQMKTNSVGMIPLNNGHFLYADSGANFADEHRKVRPCRYHEMDYMGRVYRTFLLEFPITNVVAQNGNALYLATSSGVEYSADKIVELDMNSGEIVKQCDLGELLGTKYRVKEKWANIYAMQYKNDRLYITARTLHSVIKLNWNTMEIDWILAPESVWKDTPVEKYVLAGDGSATEFCRRPNQATVVEYDAASACEKLMLYQEQFMSDLPLCVPDGDTSQIVFVHVMNNQRYEKQVAHDIEKSQRFGNCSLSKDHERVLATTGYLAFPEQGKQAKIVEMDSRTGQIYRTMFFCRRVNNVWHFEPNIRSYSHLLEITPDVVFGELTPLEQNTGVLPPLWAERRDREIFGNMRICENLLVFAMIPGKVERLWFVGENHSYVKDYSELTEGKQRITFAVSLHGMEVDEYNLYLEVQGKVHLLKNEIRVVNSEELEQMDETLIF